MALSNAKFNPIVDNSSVKFQVLRDNGEMLINAEVASINISKHLLIKQAISLCARLHAAINSIASNNMLETGVYLDMAPLYLHVSKDTTSITGALPNTWVFQISSQCVVESLVSLHNSIHTALVHLIKAYAERIGTDYAMIAAIESIYMYV